MNDQMNILERIRGDYYQLTASEKKVADYVLAHGNAVEYMSITQLADECGIAEATISRFCRRLGVKGFNAFKLEIAKLYVADRAEPPETYDPDTPEGRREQSRLLAEEAIRQTVELLDPKQLRRVAELIEQADNVLCMGSGGSMIMASECAHLFSTVCGKFQTVTESHSQLSAVATAGHKDLVFLFSYSGATTNGIQLLELAKKRGIRTVLVTRFSKSPAAKLADQVLRCGSNESPYQFGSVPARVAQLMVIDLLFREYYARNRAKCDLVIHTIADALSEKHL